MGNFLSERKINKKKTVSFQNQFAPSPFSGECGCQACLNARESQNELIGSGPTSEGGNSDQLSSYYLISQEFSNHTKNIPNESPEKHSIITLKTKKQPGNYRMEE